jgi:hypothetical protein
MRLMLCLCTKEADKISDYDFCPVSKYFLDLAKCYGLDCGLSSRGSGATGLVSRMTGLRWWNL